MDQFKLTSWNIKAADRLVTDKDSSTPSKKRRALARLDAIKEVVSGCDADILFVSEGPKGAVRAREFFDIVAPDYDLITRPVDTAREYGIDNGTQWLWFLVRRGLGVDATLQHIDRWEAAVESESNGDHKDGRWNVSLPDFEPATGRLRLNISGRWDHYRHPQVLQVEIDGHYFEVIGCHLRSKHTSTNEIGSSDDADFFDNNGELVAEIISDRVKLVTECVDIRHYLDSRFREDVDAAVIVAGDLNDGPGKERIERRFMYQDLVTALQGDVFFARRFLNHALFDAPEDERWSVDFQDPLDSKRSPHILLDHIMFTQSMTRSHPGTPFAYVCVSGSGKVEHEVFHRVTSTRYKYATPSDHRPVSMTFAKRDAADGA